MLIRGLGVFFESLSHSFFERCLNDQRVFEIAEFASDPLQRGIYPGVPD
jgi:hypothetical protein